LSPQGKLEQGLIQRDSWQVSWPGQSSFLVHSDLPVEADPEQPFT
jgi:hypothetical protein